MILRKKEKMPAALATCLIFCVAALFFLSSCGDSDDDDAAAVPMDGFFLTQGSDGNIQCLSEDLEVTFDEVSGGSVVDGVSRFGDISFESRGYVAENVNEGANTRLFVVAYTRVEGDSVSNPGIYYLQEETGGSGTYVGFWVGKPNMPPEGTEGLICPYYLEPDGGADRECPAAVVEKLGDTCYHTNENGFVDPDPVN